MEKIENVMVSFFNELSYLNEYEYESENWKLLLQKYRYNLRKSCLKLAENEIDPVISKTIDQIYNAFDELLLHSGRTKKIDDKSNMFIIFGTLMHHLDDEIKFHIDYKHNLIGGKIDEVTTGKTSEEVTVKLSNGNKYFVHALKDKYFGIKIKEYITTPRNIWLHSSLDKTYHSEKILDIIENNGKKYNVWHNLPVSSEHVFLVGYFQGYLPNSREFEFVNTNEILQDGSYEIVNGVFISELNTSQIKLNCLCMICLKRMNELNNHEFILLNIIQTDPIWHIVVDKNIKESIENSEDSRCTDLNHLVDCIVTTVTEKPFHFEMFCGEHKCENYEYIDVECWTCYGTCKWNLKDRIIITMRSEKWDVFEKTFFIKKPDCGSFNDKKTEIIDLLKEYNFLSWRKVSK